MKLDLRQIAREPGAALPFDFDMDLSKMEWNGGRPVTDPVHVEGEVRNKAGAMFLTAAMSSELSLTCDRCLKPFTRRKTVEYATLLSDEVEDGESDEIVPIGPDRQLELDGLLSQIFLLELDTKNLCDQNCRGICPGCGADLNTEPCRCKKETDPRLAKLAALLEQGEET